jgi:hypothetical protein
MREGQLAFIQCKGCGCRGALATKGKALAIHVKTQANGIRDPKVSPRRERLLQTHVQQETRVRFILVLSIAYFTHWPLRY